MLEAVWEHGGLPLAYFLELYKDLVILENIHVAVQNVLGYEIPNTCLVMYLGNIKGVVIRKDIYLSTVLFGANKKAITRHWLKISPPKQEH